VKPARTVLQTQNRLPIEIAGLNLADGGVAAVRAAGSGAHAKAALSKVEAVADGTADSIVRNPADERRIDATLKDEIFNEAANGVISECGCNGGIQAETAAQAAGDVVFAAAFPHLKLTRCVDAAFAGVETKHDFAEAKAVPAAIGIGNGKRVHGQPIL
jgi:hypothetical protein